MIIEYRDGGGGGGEQMSPILCLANFDLGPLQWAFLKPSLGYVSLISNAYFPVSRQFPSL